MKKARHTALPNPGEAEKTAGFSQRGRKPFMAHLGVSGQASGTPRKAEPTPSAHHTGPFTHLSLDHWGALSCQCWAGGTRYWALTVAPCHQQESTTRRRS